MQLILVLETRKSCNSDYRYIKSTLDYFYKTRNFAIRPIYAKTKSELINKNKRIEEEKKLYKRESVVVICADYDSNNDSLNGKIISYCKENNFDIVWMNRNIEHVYTGNGSVKNKEQQSREFLKKSQKFYETAKHLSIKDVVNVVPSSNILNVFDKYLPRK